MINDSLLKDILAILYFAGSRGAVDLFLMGQNIRDESENMNHKDIAIKCQKCPEGTMVFYQKILGQEVQFKCELCGDIYQVPIIIH